MSQQADSQDSQPTPTEQPQAAAAAHAAYDLRYAGGNKFDLAGEQTSF